MYLDRSSSHWFAVQVAPRKERLAATMLAYKGYEHFLPLARYTLSRPTMMHPPLFPGYLFCRFGMDVMGPLLTTPGVIRIVGIGNHPVPVEEHEINDIRRIQESGTLTERCPFPEIGQKVVVRSGPLAGVEGVLVSHNQPDFLVVSITLLQRSIRVRLHANWVVAAPPTVSSTSVHDRAPATLGIAMLPHPHLRRKDETFIAYRNHVG